MSEGKTGDDSVRLSVSSAVVLGLLSGVGSQTTYDLAQYIEISIGFFWPFPNSQLYAETKRLEAAGLIIGEQEDFGRRRRLYSITDEGRRHLAEWLAAPTDRHTEIRDVGLVKLFLMGDSDEMGARELADSQRQLHEERLAQYQAIAKGFVGERRLAERTIEMGIAFETVAIDFWRGIAEED